MTRIVLCLCMLAFSGCSFSRFAGNLQQAVLNSDDPETVAEALPSYLLLMESLVAGDPKNQRLLRGASGLYNAYAGLFVEESQRSQKLSAKALEHAWRAACLGLKWPASLRERGFRNFRRALKGCDRKDLPALYCLGTAWAGWVRAHGGETRAAAKLPYVEEILLRVVELSHRDGRWWKKKQYREYLGGAHLYLGVFAAQAEPEEARKHFERAIKLFRDKNLLAKVMYAAHYARGIKDRALHDRLLKEVLSAKAHVPGHTLTNTLAQRQARELLESADEFFTVR